MLNSTIYTVYTDTLATELPQVDLGATKALDLWENQPASYILTKLAAICATMATKLPQLRMRKTYLRWAESDRLVWSGAARQNLKRKAWARATPV